MVFGCFFLPFYVYSDKVMKKSFHKDFFHLRTFHVKKNQKKRYVTKDYIPSFPLEKQLQITSNDRKKNLRKKQDMLKSNTSSSSTCTKQYSLRNSHLQFAPFSMSLKIRISYCVLGKKSGENCNFVAPNWILGRFQSNVSSCPLPIPEPTQNFTFTFNFSPVQNYKKANIFSQGPNQTKPKWPYPYEPSHWNKRLDH